MPIVKVIHAYENVVVDIVWSFKDGTSLRERRTPPQKDVRRARQEAEQADEKHKIQD